LGQLMLVAEDGVSSAVAVEWTDGGKRAVGRVHGNPALGGRVLADDTRYEVRLDGFADAAGNPIAHPAHVAFTTGTLDALLNHSCGHVTFGPFASVAATAGALDAPYADTGHVSYTVQLPRQGDGYHGYTRFRVATGTRYDLFLDRPVAVIGVAGEREHPLATAATPPACDGITHRAWFTADADGEWLLSHAAGSPSFNMIVEATAAR
jgi:hypothetical protein